MTPVELVLSRLPGATRSGAGWTARCLAHEDQRASLSIAEGEDGRALLHCHAGCRTDNVVAAMDLAISDLFPHRGGSSSPRGETGAGDTPQPREDSNTRTVGLTLAQYAEAKSLP